MVNDTRLGSNDNVCLLKRDVGPTNMLPRYQNRCVTCVWLGLGLDLGPRGQRMRIGDSGVVWQDGLLCVLCTLCNVKYEQLLHQHQDLANQHLGDIGGQERCTRVLLERPAQRERNQTGWCDRCVGTQLPNRTPRLHLRPAFDIDVQTKPKAGPD